MLRHNPNLHSNLPLRSKTYWSNHALYFIQIQHMLQRLTSSFPGYAMKGS